MECIPSPSPEQLALALAIVKSKPAGLDIREYILQTRQFVKASREAEISHSPDKFFDSVSFWKQAYEKSEAEQTKLLDRVYELEQRNEALMTKVRVREDTLLGEMAQGPLKRKATMSQTARKRAKTQLSPPLITSVANIQAFNDDALRPLDSLNESTGPFMRQFYTLQMALQKRSSNTSIVQGAITLCKTSADGVTGTLPQKPSNAKKSRSSKAALIRPQPPNLESVLHSVEATGILLFQALKRLSENVNLVQEANLLIYHIECLYEAIMNSLEQHCKIQSSQEAVTSRPITRSAAQKQVEAPKQLTSLLHRMITLLDLTCPGHRSVLEGFLYLLLSRIGKFLCLFVFQDLQLRPDLRIVQSQLSMPAGIVDVELNDKLLSAAQVEARYLIWLLERALPILDTPSVLDPAVSKDQPEPSQFISSIKARLQSTLIQAVFGANEDFGRNLKRAIQPDDLDLDRLSKTHQISKLSVSDWYIQEVWRLLGWEVLMKSKDL
ncbi:hypothetical protein BDW59DRAFT_158764 [Aspergillus cavernicola]|uniref:Uncharacterized protein n=1 Tax=Aspergillus cavernicola TaxID=176166 RepID=A0ABR4IRY2_9EURO